jgi:hypothetical protein
MTAVVPTRFLRFNDSRLGNTIRTAFAKYRYRVLPDLSAYSSTTYPPCPMMALAIVMNIAILGDTIVAKNRLSAKSERSFANIRTTENMSTISGETP